MAKRLERRRIIVVEPRLQFRYLILPLVVTVTTSACLLALFILQTESLRASVSARGSLRAEIARVQLLTGVVVGAVLLGHVGLIVWLGLMASHRFAGPLYHLKKVMAEVAAGDRSARVRLRNRDQLGDVADAFNAMLDALAAKGKEPEEPAWPDGVQGEPPPHP